MKLKVYLASKALVLCFLTVLVLVWTIIMTMMEMGVTFIIMALAIAVGVEVCYLSIDFIYQKRKLAKLSNLIKKMDKPYLIGEVLKKPKNPLEAEYYEIMKAISKSAIGEVYLAEHQKEEYLEYVESWIHEIKTPLTACSLILENSGDKHKIKKELNRMDSLTENILYYARMRTLEKDTMIQHINVREVVDESLKTLMELLISAGISVEINGDLEVNSDEKVLGFIIKQLLVNSAKYCPKCHVKVTIEDNKLIYEDNGIGILPHELSRITDRGFTGTNGRKLGNSTGMGLYIVKELCDSLDIGLEFESEINKYTRAVMKFSM